MEELRIAIFTFSMGNGHIMKSIAIQDALHELKSEIKELTILTKISSENEILSSVSRKVQKIAEGIYNYISKSSSLKLFWDQASLKPSLTYLRLSEGFLRNMNFATGAKHPQIESKNPDVIISTYPTADRVALLDKSIPIIRILPDIYGHSMYFIENSNPVVYALADHGLKERIINGKEKSLHKSLIPDKKNTFAKGLFASPKNIKNQKRNLSGKLKAIFQIGGAGAQQEVFLEAMRFLDFKKVSPLFIAYNNKIFFDRLLNRGLSLDIIQEGEINNAKKTPDNGIIKFKSGLEIFYHPDKYTAVKLADSLKSEYDITVAKPGDVTSGSTPYFFLYPIGGQEILNGNWAIEKGFGKWIVSLHKYKKMAKKLTLPELNSLFGKLAAIKINKASEDKEEISGMHDSLIKTNHSGAYFVAAKSISLAMDKKKIKKNTKEKILKKLKPYL